MKVRLVDIAHARSGDKGDTANVGLIALEPRWYPVLAMFVTRDAVARHFKGMIAGGVDRFELPNLGALNFPAPRRARRRRNAVAQDRRAGQSLFDGAAAHDHRRSRRRRQEGRPAGQVEVPGIHEIPEGIAVGKRTTIQLALLVIGVIVWGYGQRIDDSSLRLVGIALFAVATMLRFFRQSGTQVEEKETDEEKEAD